VTLAMARPTTRPGRRATITPRQQQALALLAEGLGYREIALRMGITHHGVNQLLRTAYCRLGVTGHIEAFRALGWLESGYPTK
jgi:DNA-binding CsgD family transcriptional regulator